TAVSAGSATIRGTSESVSGDATLTVAVVQPPAVASVSVTLGASSLAPGQTTQTTAVASDANGTVLTGRPVTWTSLSPAVATVSASGVVTAVSAGSASIQATVETKTG